MSPRPTILVVDDLLGRRHPDGINEERANVCAHFLLNDVTGDGASSDQRVREPLADAVFERGQTPACATVGDVVSDDIERVLSTVQAGWSTAAPRWSLVLVDLSFATGTVTAASDARLRGMPAPTAADQDPARYFGLKVLAALRDRFPELPTLILSTRSRSSVALAFAELGALGFIETDADDGVAVLAQAIERHALIPDSRGRIVGRSLPLLKTLRDARRHSASKQNVLLRGESGTGKELMAGYLNAQPRTSRTPRPLQVVSTTSPSADHFHADLFGYRKGAFAEARFDRAGAIELASRGDLLLDEVSALGMAAQLALLRVVEEGQVTPLGGGAGDAKRVQVRFLSTSSADLEALVSQGAFREDLLERLQSGGVLRIPALRERRADIPLLLEHFLREAEAEHDARPRQISDEAVRQCELYAWPRNIRQLRSVVHRAVVAFPDLEHLLPHHLELPQEASVRTGPLDDGSLSALLARIEAFSFAGCSTQDLEATLPLIEEATSQLELRLLRTAFERHQRPDGRMVVQPTMRLLMGDPDLTATSAYDIINRLARRARTEPDVGDPLRSVIEQTQAKRRTRPSRPRS